MLHVFDKSKWEKLQFKEIADCISIRIEPHETDCDIYVGLEHLDPDSLKIRRYGKPQEVKGTKLKVQKGDIIFGKRRAYQRKVAVADFNGICSAHAMVLRAKPQNVFSDFLPYLVQSDAFMNCAVQISEGSLSPTIKWKALAIQEFLCPSQKEQKFVTDILHKIEDAIEQTEQQEQALLNYKKGIINSIFNEDRDFGNLLPQKSKTLTQFGMVVANIKQTEKNPLEQGLTRFVGLEHLEPENISIRRWGNIADGTTFTKRFCQGQVLFGKRRAYLKKAAIADFEGLCSGDILVFEAKSEQLRPELLLYIVHNDAFFQYAVTTSAGSLSPRTKWKDLASFTFYLPDIHVQQKLIDIFNRFEDALEQTKQHKAALIAFKNGLLNELIG